MTTQSKPPEWWPGWRQALGWLLLIFEIGSSIVLGREVDKEVVPFAIAMIVWEPQKKRQERRNRRRDRDSE